MNELRVLIVADDPLARAGLAALLGDQPGCTVVGQVAEGADLLSSLDVYRPELVLWDLGWDAISASSSLDAVLEHLAELEDTGTPVVALIPDETYALEVQSAGARGLLLRESDAERLVATLMAVAHGLVVFDPALVTPILGTRGPSSPSLVEDLTPRELEVLALLAEGLPNKAIARRLGISDHTVKFHRPGRFARRG